MINIFFDTALNEKIKVREWKKAVIILVVHISLVFFLYIFFKSVKRLVEDCFPIFLFFSFFQAWFITDVVRYIASKIEYRRFRKNIHIEDSVR